MTVKTGSIVKKQQQLNSKKEKNDIPGTLNENRDLKTKSWASFRAETLFPLYLHQAWEYYSLLDEVVIYWPHPSSPAHVPPISLHRGETELVWWHIFYPYHENKSAY